MQMQILGLIQAFPGAIAQGLIWGIMAIGVYVTFRILDIADLTVDGSLCTGGAVCIMMMLSGYNVGISLLAATGAGMLAGLATGIFHTFMGIPAILAGILTQLSLYSINLKIMGKANQAINVDKYDLLVTLRRIKNVPIFQNTIFIVAIFIVILIAILYWFFGTELGCSLRATGCNPNMSRAQGINTNFNKVLGLMLSNGLVALSGALLAQYQGFADVNMGRGAIVIGLAAVIIGEAIFGKVFHNFALRLLSVTLGSILYYMVLQTVIWLGIDTNLLKMLSALVVAFFLAFPYWKGKYFTKPVKRGGNKNA
jgi:putative ABC transport system permease protein